MDLEPLGIDTEERGCLDEYEDDEAGQKERKREDAITQQNTMQNEAVSLLDPGASYLPTEPSRTVSGRYKSTTAASEDDVSSRYTRTERSGFSRYNRDANVAGNLVSNSTLEKKIEDLEKEVVRERQENLRLVRLMQDKEEMIGKLKEEIDLLNRCARSWLCKGELEEKRFLAPRFPGAQACKQSASKRKGHDAFLVPSRRLSRPRLNPVSILKPVASERNGILMDGYSCGVEQILESQPPENYTLLLL
ncbi:PRKC apoptosis WT1 regulator protein [Sciurus carolinensis]|uniref:PRKC apoptosis WT1 regulator protein n=1 Tax=Sciurus carolinensis TaxID=30640 RepID=A0AA41N1V2_SCICA|nr:PRKC apoptosis WT1 regulator protein [Sciurus carolinensis]